MHSVVSEAAVLHLVERIYAAGCDPGEWQSLVEEIHARLPGIAVGSHLEMTGTRLSGHVAGVAPEHLESYVAHYHTLNPYIGVFEKLERGRVYTTTEHGTRAWIGRHPFYHEWLKPAGAFTYGAAVVLAQSPRGLMRVTFDIPDRLGHLEEACALLLRRLTPHMTRAFEVNERLQAAVATESALSGILDRIDGAAVLLGPHAGVYALNRRAETIARAGRLFRINAAGRLAFQHPDAEASFGRALAVALGALIDGVAFDFISAGDASMVVLPLRPAAGSAATCAVGPRALLIVRQPGTLTTTPRNLLKARYGLTNAEIDIVLQIAAGARIGDAAASLGVTRTTARNQLAHAMAKVGVHRQAELVATLLGLAPRLSLDCFEVPSGDAGAA